MKVFLHIMRELIPLIFYETVQAVAWIHMNSVRLQQTRRSKTGPFQNPDCSFSPSSTLSSSALKSFTRKRKHNDLILAEKPKQTHEEDRNMLMTVLHVSTEKSVLCFENENFRPSRQKTKGVIDEPKIEARDFCRCIVFSKSHDKGNNPWRKIVFLVVWYRRRCEGSPRELAVVEPRVLGV